MERLSTESYVNSLVSEFVSEKLPKPISHLADLENLSAQYGVAIPRPSQLFFECVKAKFPRLQISPNINAPEPHPDTTTARIGSCAEICRRRRRRLSAQGEVGIPLYDELKTSLFVASRSGRLLYVLSHIRGNDAFDEDRITSALDLDSLQKVEEAELLKMGLGFGLLNPFTPFYAVESFNDVTVEQVFDGDTCLSFGTDTMLSNAGSSLVSYEARTADVVEELGAVVAPITRNGPSGLLARIHKALHEQRAVFLGGNSTGTLSLATRLFHEAVSNALGSLTVSRSVNGSGTKPLKIWTAGDLSAPASLADSNRSTGKSMYLEGGNAHAVIEADVEAIVRYARAGVTSLAVPCHTRALFSPLYQRVCADLGLFFHSLPDAVLSYFLQYFSNIDSDRERNLLVLGGRYVTDNGPWSGYREVFESISARHPHIKVRFPRAEVLPELHQLMLDIKNRGAERYRNKVRDLLLSESLEMTSQDVVVLGTEFEEVGDLRSDKKLKRSNVTVHYGLRMLADDMAKWLLSNPVL